MSQSAISIALTALPHGLKRAALADLQHHPLDVGRVLADEGRLEVEDVRLQVRLVRLDLAVAADALVGDDAHDRVLADDGALQVGDLHGLPLLSCHRLACPRQCIAATSQCDQPPTSVPA